MKRGDYSAANLLSKGKVDVSGERNPMYGIEPWNKGKSGFVPWNKGVTGYKNKYPKNVKRKVTDETKKARSEIMKRVWAERKEQGIKINRPNKTGCKGYKWFNNGVDEIYVNAKPPNDYVKGRLKGIPRGHKRSRS